MAINNDALFSYVASGPVVDGCGSMSARSRLDRSKFLAVAQSCIECSEKLITC